MKNFKDLEIPSFKLDLSQLDSETRKKILELAEYLNQNPTCPTLSSSDLKEIVDYTLNNP